MGLQPGGRVPGPLQHAWLPGAGLAGRLAGHCRAGHCREDAVAWRRGRRWYGRHTTASAGSGCRQAASSGPTGGSWPYAAMLGELSPARNGCSTCCIGSLPHKRQRIPRPLAGPSSGDGYHVRRSAVRKAVTICRAARGPTAARGALQRQNGHRPHPVGACPASRCVAAAWVDRRAVWIRGLRCAARHIGAGRFMGWKSHGRVNPDSVSATVRPHI